MSISLHRECINLSSSCDKWRHHFIHLLLVLTLNHNFILNIDIYGYWYRKSLNYYLLINPWRIQFVFACRIISDSFNDSKIPCFILLYLDDIEC